MSFKIDSAVVGAGRTFVIAEVGSNHGGSLLVAKEHIDAAAEAGADAVKFQSINLEKLYLDPSPDIRKLHAQIDMDESWHEELLAYCKKAGITFCSTPTYMDAVELLDSLDVKLIKLASAQVGTFPQLVRAVARTKKPVFFSTGLADYRTLADTVDIFRQEDNPNYAIFHCNSLYPTPAEQVFLGRMETYRKMFHCPVGYSDHTGGISIALAAVAMGADMLEKHFLLDGINDTPDAPFSINFRKFEDLVRGVREIELARMDKPRETIEQDEAKFQEAIRYRLVLNKNKDKGEVCNLGDFVYFRHKDGIDVSSEEFIFDNMLLAVDVEEGALLSWNMLQGKNNDD
jgi:sialic acid synthase SpsE